MKRALLLLVLLIATPAHARKVWHSNGFALTTVGWFGQEEIADWLGVKVKLTIPADGYVVFDNQGSLELHIPSKGWVSDKGIIVVNGCVPNPETGKDTLQYQQMVVTPEMGCDKHGGSVLMIVRIPKMFPTSSCKPDSLRWAGGYYRVED